MLHAHTCTNARTYVVNIGAVVTVFLKAVAWLTVKEIGAKREKEQKEEEERNLAGQVDSIRSRDRE